MAKKFQTYEEALEAQTEAKDAVKEAKTALTDYYTKNKLKRNEDYTDDAKHGSKILRLQKEIDKASDTLSDINDQVKELKPKKASSPGRETKYDYPADCDTPEKKKKYRIKLRKESAADEPKSKKEKVAKKEPKSKEVPEVATKSKKEKVAKKAEHQEEAPKKAKKKVKKPTTDD